MNIIVYPVDFIEASHFFIINRPLFLMNFHCQNEISRDERGVFFFALA